MKFLPIRQFRGAAHRQDVRRRQTGEINLSLRRAAERYDKEQDLDLQGIMALIVPVVLIIMAGPIGGMAYLMINVISATISGMSK